LKCLQVTGLKVEVQEWGSGAEKRKFLIRGVGREDGGNVKSTTVSKTEGMGHSRGKTNSYLQLELQEWYVSLRNAFE
jgi:hypothetical protein